MTISTLLAQQANFGSNPVQAPSEVYAADLTSDVLTQLESLISTALGFMTVIGSLYFIFFFFLAALKWLTAGGDSGKVQKARDEMIQGVMGLIVIVAAYGVIGLIGSIVGIDILNPALLLRQLVPAVG